MCVCGGGGGGALARELHSKTIKKKETTVETWERGV